jgi:superfamily II DNA or RNA helicase
MAEADEDYAALTTPELLRYWDTVTNMDKRDRLMDVMITRKLFPVEFTDKWEQNTGAYPDIKDPQFIEKLLKRREFADSFQETWRPTSDPCAEDADEFEVSAVQRFVANFMSPKTPYRSALLYHGTGVGKTCSGIQIAEQWLNFYPNKKVIILAPPTIQKGILGNIFNIKNVRIGTEDDEPNSAVQCTGNYYMETTGTMFERDRKKIENKALNLIRRRYEIYGYGEFANKINRKLNTIPERLQGDERTQRIRKILNDEYGGRLIIIDEVHNLRDSPEDGQDKESDAPADQADEAEGKILTPVIRKLLDLADDIKFVAMTATPMYNSYIEIIFLFNLLLRNDRKPLLRLTDIFQADNTFKPRTLLPGGRYRPGGRDLLGQIAGCYVSYMRGENPITFPLRLEPRGVPRIVDYPESSPTGEELDAEAAEFTQKLPIIPVEFVGDSLIAQQLFINELPQDGGALNATQTAPILQAGTCIVPAIGGSDIKARSARGALGLHFHQQVVGGEVTFKAKQAGGAAWLAVDKLPAYAPKIAAVINRIGTAQGVCFIYTRFVRMGAIPLILALEANGYTPYGRRLGYLSDGLQVEGGRRCALCSGRESDHEPHAFEPANFVPAKYILLTGDKAISPKKDEHIEDEKQADNKDGGIIKVIVGSSVASEGVDLKFVREIHILEGWFHLNKTEQIVGRGIRTCSHALLPLEKRNCTVYLYTGVMPDNRESVDLYTYRIAYSKGRQIGTVSRVIKEHAIDCNLNHNAIVIDTRAKRQIINAQGKGYLVSLKDKPFTALCDWMESCDYTCRPSVPVAEWIERRETSEISYDEYTSRWYDSELRQELRQKFTEQPSYRKLDLFNAFGEYPTLARAALFNGTVNNPTFTVNYKGRNGYIIDRNDYFVFQPFDFGDLRIPIAIRAAQIPVRQDSYGPEFFEAKAAFEARNADEVEEVTVAEEAPKGTSLRRVLNAWSSWTVELSTSNAELPDDVITWTIGDSKEIGRREERRKMLAWFAESVRNAAVTLPAKAAILFAQMQQTLMEYFFDEELSQAERQIFFTDEELRADGTRVAPEQFLHEGRRFVFVYVDMETGEDKYLCANGKPCDESIRNHFKGTDPEDTDAEKMARNPTYGLKVDVTTTGPMYGFIVPKYGESFVFKSNKPPPVGKKVTKGQECANVSAATDHRNKLIELGKTMQKTIGTNFELTELILTEGGRKLHNVNQICMLTELFLRFMDIARINGKRWFYRPVASAVTGHLPTIRK